MKAATQRPLTRVGFGQTPLSRSNRRGEWVVVETVLEYGEETGEVREVFIGSHRECLDYRDFHDTYNNLDVLNAD